MPFTSPLILEFRAQIDYWMLISGLVLDEDNIHLDIHLECCQEMFEEWSNDDRYKNDSQHYIYVLISHMKAALEEADADADDVDEDVPEGYFESLTFLTFLRKK